MMNILQERSRVPSPWADMKSPAIWLVWFANMVLLIWLFGFRGNMEEVGHVGRSALFWMVAEWNTAGGEYSHGWLIPFVSVAIVWRQREILRGMSLRVCWSGLFVVVSALLIYALGLKIQQTRIVLVSMVMVIWGTCLSVLGLACAKRLMFPCVYLLFCVPVVFVDALTFPLRLLASSVSEGLLNGIGIPVVRLGTAIISAGGTGLNIDVADPCSGMHSLVAMAALGAAYAYFTQPRQVGKWLLFLGSLPIAVMGNVVRVMSIAIVAVLFGQEHAMSFYHDYSGYVLFSAAVMLMMAWGAVLKRWFPSGGRP